MKPQRGSLYRLRVNGTDGKPRPIVVVSRNALNGGNSVVAGGLDKDCVAKTDEITLIDTVDIDLGKGPIGQFDEAQLTRLMDGIKWTLVIE